jgi:hypothetical protein
MPGDFYRGYGVSYKYYKYGTELSIDIVKDMLLKKVAGQDLAVQLIMQDVDTVCYKYSLGKNPFSHDANFVIFRAAGIHLYAAEIHALWVQNFSGIIRPATNTSLNFLNDGTYAAGPGLVSGDVLGLPMDTKLYGLMISYTNMILIQTKLWATSIIPEILQKSRSI